MPLFAVILCCYCVGDFCPSDLREVIHLTILMFSVLVSCWHGMLARSIHRSFPVWKAPWAFRLVLPNLTRTPPSTSSSRSSRWPFQVNTPKHANHLSSHSHNCVHVGILSLLYRCNTSRLGSRSGAKAKPTRKDNIGLSQGSTYTLKRIWLLSVNTSGEHYLILSCSVSTVTQGPLDGAKCSVILFIIYYIAF